MSKSKQLFEYFSKSTLYIKIAKFAVIILLLIFSISCIIIYRRDITVENVQLLSRFISLDGSSSHYTKPFSVTVKEDSDIVMLRDNIGVVSDNNISLFDLSGRKLFSYDYRMSSPAVAYDSHYILVYDIGGTEAVVFNSFSKIKTFKFDFPIYTADINDEHVSFIYGNDISRSVLSVYTFDNKEKDYTLSYSKQFDKFINNVSLSDDKSNVLVSTISSNDGKFDCSLSVFDISSDSSAPVMSHKLVDEFPVSAVMADDASGSFAITDTSLLFLDKNLKKTSKIEYNQNKASAYCIDKDVIIYTESNNLAGNSVKVSLYSFDGTAIRNFTVPDEINDLSIGNEYVYALGKNGVYRFALNSDGKSKDAVFPIDAKYHSVVCDTEDNCYLVSYTNVSKVIF